MSDYKELKVWQRAHEFVLKIYRITSTFPASEQFGLVSQLRRAAYSIPTNIAEGQGRLHRKEYLHFLNVARGSANETEYLIILCRDLGYISNRETEKLLKELSTIAKMLNGLIKSIRRS